MTRAHVTTDHHWAPIPEAVLYDKRLSDKAVRVYGCLLRHGLTPDSCYPSHGRIAGLIGCAKRSVQRPLVELEEAGWVARTARFDESGQRVSDGYHVRTEGSLSAPPAQENVVPPAQEGADPPRTGARTEGEQENESKVERESVPGGTDDALVTIPMLDAIPATTKGARLPTFLISPAMIEWAATEATGVDVTVETRRFADYWRAIPGQRGCKLDWHATWRNWMRRAADDRRGRARPSTAEQHQDTIDHAKRLYGETP